MVRRQTLHEVDSNLQCAPRDGSYLQRPIERWKASQNLAGFTSDKVKAETARISPGSSFKTVAKFEYALRCWCVEAQRSCLFVKSAFTHKVVACRYGYKIRNQENRKSRVNDENVRPVDEQGRSSTGTDEPRQRKRRTIGHCGEEARKACASGVPDPCAWRVRAQFKQKSQTYVISVCNLLHSCPAHVHS